MSRSLGATPPKNAVGSINDLIVSWDLSLRRSSAGNGALSSTNDFDNRDLVTVRLISHIRSGYLSAATTLPSSSGTKRSVGYHIAMGKVGQQSTDSLTGFAYV